MKRKLHLKIAIYFSIFFAVFSYIIHSINKAVILKGIDDIEIQQSLIDSKELYGIFAGAIIRLRQHTSNLAMNDDSYNYINTMNKEYIDKIYNKTFINKNYFTGAAYYNKNGERLALVDGSKSAFNSNWYNHEKNFFDKVIKLLINSDNEYIEGFIAINTIEMIVVVHKVFDSNKQYPSNGYLVLTKALDSTFKNIANDVSNYKFSILTENTGNLLYNSATQISDNYRYIIKDNDIYTYSRINDIFGHTSFYIELQKPRNIASYGNEIFKHNFYITSILSFVAFLGAILMLYFTQRRFMRDEMEYHANHDKLTDLQKESFLLEQVPLMIKLAKEKKHCVGLILIGLDNFKSINNLYGHQKGDEILCEIAQRLKQLYEDNYIARSGGDKFIIVISVDNKDLLLAESNKILEFLNEYFVINGNNVRIGISIGIDIIDNNCNDILHYINNAELALSNVKEHGGNNISFYDETMSISAIKEKRIEIDLFEAIENNKLIVHFQPKVDARKIEVVGCEALVRIQAKDGKWISPADFIPIAEETGLVTRIDMFVLRIACRQVLAWEKDGIGAFPIAVNMSVRSILSEGFADQVIGILEEEGTPHSLIHIEITETSFMSDIETAFSAISRLHNAGIHVALDDFGTGYSSLQYLSAMPITFLKIDRKFVNDIFSGKVTAQPLVRSIIGLATNLGMQTICEGVEDKSQLAFLMGNGAYVIQGFLFSKPLNAVECGEYLRNSKARIVAAMQ